MKVGLADFGLGVPANLSNSREGDFKRWQPGGHFGVRRVAISLQSFPSSAEKQKKYNEDKNKAYAAAAVVSETRAHVEAATAEHQNKNNENKD